MGSRRPPSNWGIRLIRHPGVPGEAPDTARAVPKERRPDHPSPRHRPSSSPPLFAAPAAWGAFDWADPLRKERLVIESEEVVVTTATGTSLRHQVLDTPGDVAVDGVAVSYAVPVSGFRGTNFDFDTTLGDFDGERELATAP